MLTMRNRYTLLALSLAASCTHLSHAEILNAKPGDNLALIAAKAKPGDAAPTLTKNTVKKAATKKKAAKKATGKAKKSAE